MEREADQADASGRPIHVRATVVEGGTSLFATPLLKRLALVIGNEGAGVSEGVIALATRRVTIPMQPGIDSLNVAIAAAVVLYHFCRTE